MRGFFATQASSNEEMVKSLKACGSLSKATIKAFREVDRGYFCKERGSAFGGGSIYHDMPYREAGLVHLSAPSIYATALEALELEPGLSFLNAGSGTGYFSALVAHMTGPQSIHHGVEIHAELVDHARRKLDGLGLNTIELHHCSCLALDPDKSMRFDRIYVGAGASSNGKLLFSLLQVGGVMVGPFAGPEGQRLLKLRRLSETEFKVRELLAVQFTPLLQPPQPPDAPLLALLPPVWTTASHRRFPSVHREAVIAVLICHARPDSLFATLPKELLMEAIFPMLGEEAFHRPKPAAAGSSRDSAASISLGAMLGEELADVSDESGSDGGSDGGEEEDEEGSLPDETATPNAQPNSPPLEPTERRPHVLGRILRMLSGSGGSAMACR